MPSAAVGSKPRAALLACLALLWPAAAAPGTTISEARQSELVHLLEHDCGSCHGMTLRGGLGPPLTPEALAARPAQVLEHAILAGRPGTPMPPWAGILTREEIEWLVERLRQGVPDVD